MPAPIVTVVVPTLAADDALADCLRSLENQTLDRFDVIVVDNSGARRAEAASGRTRVIANQRNLGFGAAVNQAFRASSAPYLATLNDDAVAHPTWLAALIAAAEARPQAGMFASEVRMAETGTLDSAGMLIAADGSSKQRGHGEPPARFVDSKDALCPSGSAALYRRSMLDQIGLFDESFFLYCEDTDLGLRARWAGWECGYVPGAVVEHRYSHSAGRASPLKAYYVERNRMYAVLKNFPFGMMALAWPASLVRFFWHLVSLFQGRGKAAEFRQAGHSAALLPFLVLRAHAAVLLRLPRVMVRTPPHPEDAAFDRTGIPRADRCAFHQPSPGGGAVRLLILIPAFNEEGAVGGVVREVEDVMPDVPVLVVDDCSGDATGHVARAAGANVLSLPYHLGLGGCVQAGYRLAFELGYDYVIRVDGDGQHDPRDIPRILEALEREGCEMVIGSRFLNGAGEHTGFLRKLGVVFFRAVLRPILGKPVHDPTSGFVGVNRTALALFSRSFPLEYPEIEALVVLQRKRFRFVEVPCRMRPRRTGRTTITPLKSLYYPIHVLLGVFVNVLKFEGRRK